MYFQQWIKILSKVIFLTNECRASNVARIWFGPTSHHLFSPRLSQIVNLIKNSNRTVKIDHKGKASFIGCSCQNRWFLYFFVFFLNYLEYKKQ